MINIKKQTFKIFLLSVLIIGLLKNEDVYSAIEDDDTSVETESRKPIGHKVVGAEYYDYLDEYDTHRIIIAEAEGNGETSNIRESKDNALYETQKPIANKVVGAEYYDYIDDYDKHSIIITEGGGETNTVGGFGGVASGGVGASAGNQDNGTTITNNINIQSETTANKIKNKNKVTTNENESSYDGSAALRSLRQSIEESRAAANLQVMPNSEQQTFEVKNEVIKESIEESLKESIEENLKESIKESVVLEYNNKSNNKNNGVVNKIIGFFKNLFKWIK